MPDVRSDEDCRRLISTIYHSVYRGCFALMYACGLRIRETVELPVSAVDSKHMLRRKTQQALPLSEPVLAMLREVWKIHRNPKWLFADRKGASHLPRSTPRIAFNAARTTCGFNEDFTPHTLRHSFATLLLEKSINIRVVQILLEHSSLRSTEVYTHLSEPLRRDLRQLLGDFFAGLF